MATYDPTKVVVSFNGVPLSGYGSGTFIRAERRTQLMTLEDLGADGEGAFVRAGDHSYEVTLTLKRASASNAYLSRYAEATAGGVPIVGPILISDIAGSALFSGEQAAIMNPPAIEFEKGALGEHEWKFLVKRGIQQTNGYAT